MPEASVLGLSNSGFNSESWMERAGVWMVSLGSRLDLLAEGHKHPQCGVGLPWSMAAAHVYTGFILNRQLSNQKTE